MDNSSINSIFYSYLLELHLNPQEFKDFDSQFILSLIKIFNNLPENKRDKAMVLFHGNNIKYP